MDTADLQYRLPESAIAQEPAEPRDSARLLVAARGAISEHRVADLADLLDPDDIVVVNDSRVIPARLHLEKRSGGAVEVLLLHRRPEGFWEALVRPGRRVPPGTQLLLRGSAGMGPVVVEVGDNIGADGRRLVRFMESDGWTEQDVLAQVGEIPLPPYIHQTLANPDRYQTVYANRPGSVAAPTAGLHLTSDLLNRCANRGITIAKVELLVGLGTFRPITTERVEDHPMHAEQYRIPSATSELLNTRLANPGGPGRVVAVGTTTVRALETWASTGCSEGETSLFIHGDYPFRIVDRLLTNFHVPGSSLLAMVESFGGSYWRSAYQAALDAGFRFLSFGDAMLVDRDALRTVPQIVGELDAS